jgi:hypothetical protein
MSNGQCRTGQKHLNEVDSGQDSVELSIIPTAYQEFVPVHSAKVAIAVSGSFIGVQPARRSHLS